MMNKASVPLFPLSSVLYPDGVLSLRIFEQRYLDMIRDCARHSSPFGVCLILAGQEAGEPAQPAAFGTLAHIIDFHTLPDGLLGIHARGGERFHVLQARVRDNGLILGDIETLDAEAVIEVPPSCGLLATILERLHEQIGGEFARVDRQRYDDAGWVGFRLAEALPLEAQERQLLLELTDPIARLEQLMHYLPRFQDG